MPGVVWIRRAFATCLVCTIAGCGSDSFLPPPRPELNAVREGAVPAAAKLVDLILDGPDTEDRTAMIQMAVKDAGIAKVSLRASGLKAGDSPDRQAALIRESVAHGAAALIVEAIDAPPVVDALNEARKKGIQIVILDRALASGERGKPFPRVTFEPFDKVALEMVEAAKNEAAHVNIPPDGKAIILVNEKADNHTVDRVAAIKSALEKVGISLAETLTFAGDAASAEAVLGPKIRGHRTISYVFAEDDRGLSGAYAVRQSQDEGKAATFLASGFVSYDLRLRREAVSVCAAVVDRNLEGLVRKSIDVAVALTNGKAVPDVTLVRMTCHAAKPAIGPPADGHRPPPGPGPPPGLESTSPK